MFPRDYDDYDIEIQSDNGTKLLINAKAKTNRRCTKCGGDSRPHQTDRTKMYDISDDGKVVKIDLARTRHKCCSCGSTFYDQERPECFRARSKLSMDLIEAAVDTVIMSTEPIATIADKYEMGKTVLSDALHRRIEDKQTDISTLEEPDVLIVVPFPYKVDICYAVFGITDCGSESPPQREYLYDIRKGYSASDISAFLTAHPFNGKHTLQAEFADDNPDIQTMFAKKYGANPNNLVCVLRRFLKEKITSTRERCVKPIDTTEETADDVIKHLENALSPDTRGIPFCLDCFETSVEEDESAEIYLENLEYVWGGTSEDTKKELSALYNYLQSHSPTMDFVFYNRKKIAKRDGRTGRAYDFEECETIEQFLRYIKLLNDYNTPFEQIRFRACTSYAAENAENISMKTFMLSSYTGKSISQFRINLRELNKHLIDNLENDLWPIGYGPW